MDEACCGDGGLTSFPPRWVPQVEYAYSDNSLDPGECLPTACSPQPTVSEPETVREELEDLAGGTGGWNREGMGMVTAGHSRSHRAQVLLCEPTEPLQPVEQLDPTQGQEPCRWL